MNEVIDILKRVGGIITDSHFVYTSGKHGRVYLNKDAIYPHTAEVSRIGELFAEANKDLDIDIVVGPALGAIILSQWTAHHLSSLKGREILAIYTEKTSDKDQIFTRGYDKLIAGKKVLAVEDLTTTGGSIRKVVESIKTAGGTALGVSVMINRNPEGVGEEEVGAPFKALAEFPAEAYDEAECPMCKEGVPLNTEVGHGKKFAAAKEK